jgi:hypothetical protein
MADKTSIAARQHIESLLRTGFSEDLGTFGRLLTAPFQILFN